MQVIAHNMLSQFAERQLNITDNNKSKSSEKLSSGYRVNRAADDAAGLAISEKLRWQVRGLKRASLNISDGISLCQVAEGALNEVHAMLHRMNELAIQASNDSNTQEDRKAIQMEIDALLDEIDRIGDDTEYNTMKLFQGGYTDVLDANGNPVRLCDIPITDFHLPAISNVNLNDGPVYMGSQHYLNLSATLTENAYTNTNFDLIFGRGSTSHSSIKVKYKNDNGETVTVIKDLDDLPIESESFQENLQRYGRVYKLKDGDIDLSIMQEIYIEPHTGTSQDYRIRYSYMNNSDKMLDIDFMFNADSAYNDDDNVEGYFIDGQRVENFSLYSTRYGNDFYMNLFNQNSPYIYDSFRNFTSFSIVDVDNALPFAVKVGWEYGYASSPDALSIGNYYAHTWDWNYYENLSHKLGGNTNGQDLAFSLLFNYEQLRPDTAWSTAAEFTYGFTQTSTDQNLAGIPITYNQTSKVHVDVLDLWIQAGAVEGSGMWVSIGAMDSGILGIRGLDVTSHEHAQRSMERVREAVEAVSQQRSLIGVQQNRLEHAKAIDDNTAENSQATESRIRDTDMAAEMVNHSRHNILQQAGQSMLSQANQIPKGVLQLLQ